MLLIVSTPIGNLSDITFRAVEELKSSDLILCEDTRHASILLNHYSIKVPTKSFHQFNESKMEDFIISLIKEEKKIALISDAGTPTISDPGGNLIAKCISENLPVSAIPGPCAAITGLTASGLDATRFQFVGFLPKKEQALKKELLSILPYTGTTICYESPHRVLDLIKTIAKIDPDRKLVVARELTKKFESFYRGTALNLYEELKSSTFKGEIVLLIGENPHFELSNWDDLEPQDHVTKLQEVYGISKIEAIKTVVQLRGLSRKDLYN